MNQPKFSARHYEVIAKIFAARFDGHETKMEAYWVKILAHDFVDAFMKDNSKFDFDKFLTACRIKSDE